MKQFKTYLIDLDGTLVDSRPGIFACIRHALKTIGKEEKDENVLNSFIGPPLYQSLSECMGINNDELKIALAAYVKKYEEEGQFLCSLYPNVVQTLQALKSRGATLALATSKWEYFAKQITDRLNITQYFDLIQGGGANGYMCDKYNIIRQCIEKLSINKSHAVMLGDRKYDIIGANKHKIESIGVLYGYGDKKELLKNRATYLINDLLELL